MKRIGFVEIGMFGSSLVLLGLIIWFLTLTFFGSSAQSQAQLMASLPAAVGSGTAVLKPLKQIPQPQPQPVPVAKEMAAEPPQTEAPPSKPAPEPVKQQPVSAVVNQAPLEPSAATVQPPSEDIAVVPPPEPAVKQETLSRQPPSAELRGTLDPSETGPRQNPVSDSAGSPMTAGSVAYAPKSERDPMMTPREREQLERQKKIKEETERRERERELARKKASDPFEISKRKIEVQGVLDTDEGMLVIVNNQILRQGDSVAGSKIVRITSSKVIFKFQGRLFEKIFKGD